MIDHDGDNAFDVVLVTTSYPATVTSVSPLTVDVDGETQTVRAFSSTDVFTVGEAVYYSQICGNGYIRRHQLTIAKQTKGAASLRGSP